ncbi:hypothetical protein EV421DRAFT_902941 [Armillaria borealis]|uniref:F-box domain-containing protein n=1 Tax=Armillaria borealis TaxID=47425 RepID=A0AA39K0R0_9AGAR|nr:hypothetical protein EV421DRAFT_902941 [Armillaria borealis]
MEENYTSESATFHLDALERLIPEPSLLPSDGLKFDASDLLRARRPFLKTDRPHIRSTLTHLRKQDSEYNALLDRLKKVEQKVRDHRHEIRKSHKSWTSTLAPIHRLPYDVLLAVFQQVRRRDWDYYGNVFSVAEGPWILSHVCGLWRDTVLSSPSLWSCLTINFVFADSKSAPVLLETIFRRSGSLPLNIAVFAFRDSHPSVSIQAFAAILRHCRRWRHVVLRLEPCFLKEMNIVKRDLPALESLLLYPMVVSPRNILPESERNIFSSAPRLRKVALYKMHGLGDFALPSHVTHLAGCPTDLYHLETYQFLEECHLDSSMISQVVSLPTPISLPKVRRLYVDSTCLLRHLHLPSLQHLTLAAHVMSVLSDQDAINLNDLLRRSRCNLDSLAVGPGMVSGSVFLQQSLTMMQSLSCLDITLQSTEDSFFSTLASSPAILPDLQRLHLRHYSTDVRLTTWNSLTSMIDTRWHTSPLDVIRVIATSKYVVEPIAAQFIPLQEDGLDVAVVVEHEAQDLDQAARITFARLENLMWRRWE